MTLHTGPRTALGKLKSSRNALKKGIYTNALLPGEDPQALEELTQNLRDSYLICDAAGEITVGRFLQHTLQTKRLQQAQIDLVEAKMHRQSTRLKFCEQVNLTPSDAENLPDWYFDHDPIPKEQALVIFQAFQDAEQLKNNYTPDLMHAAKNKFPHLWEYLMGKPGSANQKVYATLGERLASHYKQSQPQSNIQRFLDELNNEFPYELLWAENEVRYKSIIAGLRSDAFLEVMSDPNLNKAEAALHRRMHDLLTSMVALKRENADLVEANLAKEVQELPATHVEAIGVDVQEP